mgnify:CR=1 FL=1
MPRMDTNVIAAWPLITDQPLSRGLVHSGYDCGSAISLVAVDWCRQLAPLGRRRPHDAGTVVERDQSDLHVCRDRLDEGPRGLLRAGERAGRVAPDAAAVARGGVLITLINSVEIGYDDVTKALCRQSGLRAG